MFFGLFGKKEEEEEEFIIVRAAKIHTERGVLNVELFEDDAPMTVESFCNLAEKGFYKNMIFHRVIPNTLIQTGCPKGDGTGGAGYFIKCELGGKNQVHDKGVLSMANCGRNTGSSQFFICLGRMETENLNGNHTCFGRVIEDDLEYLEEIKAGDKMTHIEITRRIVSKEEAEAAH
jgi:peptidyl-prolyl cis-trans isomerase B (cyclophilin B)